MMVRHYLGDLGAGTKALLRSIIKKRDIRMWDGFSWLRIGMKC
jgi:hypothetical protein